MQIPEVKVVRKDNLPNRLTVAFKRITLKLHKDISDEDVDSLKFFAIMIAQRTLTIFRRTMRGCFSNDLCSIQMFNSNRGINTRYDLEKLINEGFMSEGMESNVCTRPKIQRQSAIYKPVNLQSPHWYDDDDDLDLDGTDDKYIPNSHRREEEWQKLWDDMDETFYD